MPPAALWAFSTQYRGQRDHFKYPHPNKWSFQDSYLNTHYHETSSENGRMLLAPQTQTRSPHGWSHACRHAGGSTLCLWALPANPWVTPCSWGAEQEPQWAGMLPEPDWLPHCQHGTGRNPMNLVQMEAPTLPRNRVMQRKSEIRFCGEHHAAPYSKKHWLLPPAPVTG